jgi:hypothetical protein
MVFSRLQTLVTQYIRKELNEISIAIIRQGAMVDSEIEDVELAMAFKGATVGQMHRVKKILLNILSYWAPFLGRENDFVREILTFISDKLLVLLSSIGRFPQPRFDGTPADVFRLVYGAVESAGWLNQQDLLPYTVPIRAAAAMYQAAEVTRT